MPLWVFILITFGGLIIIGIIVDLIAKLRGKKISFDHKNKNMGKIERVDSESFMHEIKKGIQDQDL